MGHVVIIHKEPHPSSSSSMANLIMILIFILETTIVQALLQEHLEVRLGIRRKNTLFFVSCLKGGELDPLGRAEKDEKAHVVTIGVLLLLE